jgi:hypothetical protein
VIDALGLVVVILVSISLGVAGASAGLMAALLMMRTSARVTSELARQPLTPQPLRGMVVTLGLAMLPLSLWAYPSSVPDNSIRQFLAQDDTQHPYKATRRLEAANGDRTGWVDATTEYSRDGGFSYVITAEGGSSYIRTKVLRAVLDGEREAFARGETAGSALAHSNYIFEPSGLDDAGLVNVRLSPRRKERTLVTGMMFLQPDDGSLVRLQGRLARSPSFWVKQVEIVRSYARINNVVLPVELESQAQLRLLGPATLRMTYLYSEVDGHAVASSQSASR